MTGVLTGTINPLTNGLVPGIDPYSATAAIDAVKESNPAVYELAAAGGPPPEPFFGGNLPAFTASGLDPSVLLQFPWNQRHAVAAMKSSGEVYDTLTDYADQPGFTIPAPGLNEYVNALHQWMVYSKSPTEDPDAVYEAIFGKEGGR